MDTLSRDSNSSGSIMPIVGVIAGGLALVLAIVALVKLSTLQKTVAAHDEGIAKIPALESQVSSAASKSDLEMSIKRLSENIQGVFDNQVGPEMGRIKASVAKLEEQMAKKAAAPAGKGGAAAAPTGVLNPDGTYTIAAGDNLSRIATKFGVKVDAIEAENPGIDSRRLRVGQKIRIPRR